MITESTLYWITRLDNFRTLCVVMLAIFILMALAFLAMALDDDISKKDSACLVKCLVFFVFPAIFLFANGLVFIPSTKQMCAIKVIPMLAQNERVQGLGEKALALTEAWLDELKPSKK